MNKPSEISMQENLNLRIFRRNPKNIIIIWNSAHLTGFFTRPVSAMVIDEAGDMLLTYSKFVPDAPEKFPKDIDGIVISHSGNNLDANKAYKIKIAFGDRVNGFEIIKEVMPVNSFTIPDGPKEVQAMHMYAFDYRKQKWVPFPFDPKVLENIDGSNS
jgi:hypothetical protein